jgi:hypothetical protein
MPTQNNAHPKAILLIERLYLNQKPLTDNARGR